jgi:hypothetical protein
MGYMENAYKLLVTKPEGKKPHGRCRHRWEDIRLDWWEGVAWIHLAQESGWW